MGFKSTVIGLVVKLPVSEASCWSIRQRWWGNYGVQ